MTIIAVLFLAVFLTFAFVIAYGAPYLPTHRKQTSEALDLLNLKPGQTIIELGSGDGRVLREAASRGIYAIGYELNPLLALYSMWRNIKYRKYITVHLGNYWNKKLPITDGVYVFLIQKYMSKLNTKIINDMKFWGKKHSLNLVSYAFEIPDKNPTKQQNGLFLYKY